MEPRSIIIQGLLQKLGGGAVGVSCSGQQLTGLPDIGVYGLTMGSQGSPAHFRETSTRQQ